MPELSYPLLWSHAGHDLTVWTSYNERVGIGCVECHEDLVILENTTGWVSPEEEDEN